MTIRDDSRLFDVRTLERNVRKGLVSKKDVEKHIKGLPDAADKATACNPEAQSREAERPAPRRPVVIATPRAAGLDEAGPEDDLDDLDDDLEDEDEDEAEEADAKGEVEK